MSILAIILSFVAVFVVGFAWYGPIFGKTWMEASNIPEDAPKNMKVSSFALNILGSLIVVIGYQYVLYWFAGEYFTISLAFTVALVGWLIFMLPSLLDAMAWKNVSFKGFLIDGLYRYTQLVIIGLLFLFI